MRTYDDTFSGTKIYPGKVRLLQHQPTSTPPSDDHINSPTLPHLAFRTSEISRVLMYMTGQTLRPRRLQGVPFPEWQDRVSVPAAQEPEKNSLDGVVSEDA
jgi:hypothetical protein